MHRVAGALDADRERDRPGHVADGEIAGDVVPVVGPALDASRLAKTRPEAFRRSGSVCVATPA
jgi:hypothetical protein